MGTLNYFVIPEYCLPILSLCRYGLIDEWTKATIRTFIASMSDNSMADVTGSVYQWYNLNRLFYDNNGLHPSETVTLGVSLRNQALKWPCS